jgi:two-component system CheB/CheR fusion protein
MKKKPVDTTTGINSSKPSKVVNNNEHLPLFVIAIGASAGGLEALQEFLTEFPTNIKNVTIIIAQHLSTTHKSMLVQLLRRNTLLPVNDAKQGAALLAGEVYITPSDTEISVSEGKFILHKPKKNFSPKPSIDILFQSLAADQKKNVIAIILSGTGSDGTVGIKAIKEAGGLTFAQDPKTAKYDGMPSAAIESGQIDFVLSPADMGAKIKELLLSPETAGLKKAVTASAASAMDRLFRLLQLRTGINFTDYKKSSFCRRVEKRMELVKISSLDNYISFVEKNPDELDALLDTCLIGVTSFFRDKEAFDSLKKHLAKIIKDKAPGEPVRIWCAGCSNGEEAYTVAIIAYGLLKEKQQQHTLQIFATDINEKALAFARQATYSANTVKGLPKQLTETCFIKKGDKYELVKALRATVLFSKHDLTNNPPFIKLDLITCRNLLIYFNPVLQQHVIPVLHYALNPDGILMLGKSESIGQFTDLFSVLDKKNKLFQRIHGSAIHSLHFTTIMKQTQSLFSSKIKKEQTGLSVAEMVKETLFNTFEHPYVVINDNYDIQEIYGDVSPYLSLQSGLMNISILKLVNKELLAELRSIISKSVKDKQPQRTNFKKYQLAGNTRYIRLSVKPLIYLQPEDHLFIVIFERYELSESLERNNDAGEDKKADAGYRDLENELAVTTEHLQTYIEELESSNEELQLLNEELQSTNEELQSASEELESSNEELQSANEEIQSSYAELKNIHEELEKKDALLREKEANQFALLNNTVQGFVLVAPNYTIIALNNRAKQIIDSVFHSKIPVGESIINCFDTSVVDTIIADLKRVVTGQSFTEERSVPGKRGKLNWILLSYTPVLSGDGKITVVSIGILDITEHKRTEEIKNTARQLRQLTNYLQNVREDERKRIGTELHDGLMQQLAVLKMSVSWLHSRLASADESIMLKLKDLLDLMHGMMGTVMKIYTGLRPSILDDLGLSEAIDWYLKEFEKGAEVIATFSAPDTLLHLSDKIKTCLFRIFQESLTNVACHANARKVEVILKEQEGHIILTIKDDGKGFDPKNVAGRKTLGLMGMEERCLMMGGNYQISSSPGNGTLVTASIPNDRQQQLTKVD